MTAAELKSKFFTEKKNGGLKLSVEEIACADAFCEGYKTFLDNAKTEFEAVETLIALAEEKGFVPFEPGKKYSEREVNLIIADFHDDFCTIRRDMIAEN